MRSLLICLLTISTSLFCEEFNGPTNLSLKVFDELTINGPANLSLIKAKTLNVNGTLRFESLDVSGIATINGPVSGSKGKFHTLTISGAVDVDHALCDDLIARGAIKASYLIVKNHTEIEGLLDASHSEFNTLDIKADSITLDEVSINNINILKGRTLILKGLTVVNGDIVFDGGKGIVKIHNPEVKINGSIKGGALQNLFETAQ